MSERKTTVERPSEEATQAEKKRTKKAGPESSSALESPARAREASREQRTNLAEAVEANKRAYEEAVARQSGESAEKLDNVTETNVGSGANSRESSMADDVQKEFNTEADEARRQEPTLYTPPRIERVGPVTMPAHTEKPSNKDPGQKGIERLARHGRRFADVPFEIQ